MDPVIERKFARMQSVIRLGRLIRERNVIKANTPLSKVTVVDLSAEARQDITDTQRFILEEINCQELETQANEDEYLSYKSTPDNTLCGKAFGKTYKTLKPKLQALTND